MATVNVIERIKELALELEIDISEGEFEYSYSKGYEILKEKRDSKHGGMEYQGSYHPLGYCEGKGICIRCGSTLFNLEKER